MRYLKIQNKGLLNTEFLQLMGVSSKTGDSSKIGKFGTGLKYAVCYFLRHKLPFQLFVGNKEVKFEVREVPVKGVGTVELVYMNGKRTGLSLQYGSQWKLWEAIREIYCNALDEDKELVIETSDHAGEFVPAPKAKCTTFYFQVNPELQTVLDNWHHYFINKEPLFDSELVAIYPASTDGILRIYKQGILVHENDYYHSLYQYDFKDCRLNELRQYGGYLNMDIEMALIGANEEVVKGYLEMYNTAPIQGKPLIERSTPFDWISEIPEEAIPVWDKFIYLYPSSDRSESVENSYKVPTALFELLKRNNMSVEKVATTRRWYGGVGGRSHSGGTIRIIDSKDLELKIMSIVDKFEFEGNFGFVIGSQFAGEDFDFTEYKQDNTELICFHSQLKNKSDEYLEAIVRIAMRKWLGKDLYEQLREWQINNLQFHTLEPIEAIKESM